jgi:uncharacterized protein
MTPLLWVASLSLVGIGIVGILLPALPGTPLIYIGLLLAAWGDGFQYVSIGTMIFLGVLTLVAFVADFVSGSVGAKRVGASREAVIGAFLGAIAGIFFGFVGVFFGPFIGAVTGEFIARRNMERAGFVGIATWLGFILGVGMKLMLAFAMVGIFIIAYVF